MWFLYWICLSLNCVCVFCWVCNVYCTVFVSALLLSVCLHTCCTFSVFFVLICQNSWLHLHLRSSSQVHKPGRYRQNVLVNVYIIKKNNWLWDIWFKPSCFFLRKLRTQVKFNNHYLQPWWEEKQLKNALKRWICYNSKATRRQFSGCNPTSRPNVCFCLTFH